MLGALKSLSLAVAVVVASSLAGSDETAAQEPQSAQARQTASELYPVLLGGVADEFAETFAGLLWPMRLHALQASNPDIDEDLLQELQVEFTDVIRNRLVDVFGESASAELADVFSAQDMRQLAEFYGTPVGARWRNEFIGIAQQAMAPALPAAEDMYSGGLDLEAFDAVLAERGLRR